MEHQNFEKVAGSDPDAGGQLGWTILLSHSNHLVSLCPDEWEPLWGATKTHTAPLYLMNAHKIGMHVWYVWWNIVHINRKCYFKMPPPSWPQSAGCTQTVRRTHCWPRLLEVLESQGCSEQSLLALQAPHHNIPNTDRQREREREGVTEKRHKERNMGWYFQRIHSNNLITIITTPLELFQKTYRYNWGHLHRTGQKRDSLSVGEVPHQWKRTCWWAVCKKHIRVNGNTSILCLHYYIA